MCRYRFVANGLRQEKQAGTGTCVLTEINFCAPLGEGNFRAGAVGGWPAGHVTRLSYRKNSGRLAAENVANLLGSEKFSPDLELKFVTKFC